MTRAERFDLQYPVVLWSSVSWVRRVIVRTHSLHKDLSKVGLSKVVLSKVVFSQGVLSRPSVALCAALLLSACAGSGHHQQVAASAPAAQQTPDYGPVDGSIYRQVTARSLFEDRKARRVGDLVTVILVENMNARKSASTSTQKESSLDMPDPYLLGADAPNFLSNQLDSSRGFKGSGNSAQSNSLSGTVTARVVEVLPDGALRIQGDKQVRLNQGEEQIRISGLVRPEDISSANTVSSTRIGDARITYAGTGTLADANSMGWLSRFFNSALWPF